ncbi:hypothetical protein [Bacillus sp. JJ722]|uniref:hypothetical protein n=1 Tax=Bacillus sp. JJ722 TaxID=3122973 RepID=UPI002FFDD284
MSFVSSLRERYTLYCETSDSHHDKHLRTHYYKSSKQQAISHVQQIIQQNNNLTIVSISEEHGELCASFQTSIKGFIVVSIIPVTPLEVAVDLTVSTDQKRLTGSNPILKEMAMELYKLFNQQMNLAKQAV